LANPTHKEACRLFYMVKGHLPNDINTIYACYNNECYTHEIGFEEEYKKMLDKQHK
jgi:hypothetical protein